MGSRLPSRLRVLAWAGLNALKSIGRRAAPQNPQRILIVHHLLLGDTLMLTPLLAKLRARHPAAEIVMAVPKAISPLYARRPYGVTAIPFDPRDASTLRALRRCAGFDLALVPGDNRYSWLALALDARWIVAFAGDRPAYKSWPVDALLPYPATPAAWGDMVADLISGPSPAPYDPRDWPAPEHAPFSPPRQPYCVLHVGASSALKLWAIENWRALADWLQTRGYQVVWSSGKGEEKLVAQANPDQRDPAYAGQLDLAQLWHLLRGASLLVCPDTGVAHLGRLTGTPTVALFGPGSASLYGAGEFWRDSPYAAVTVEPFPCRDQRLLFKREISWVRRCARSLGECAAPRCMQAIETEAVTSAITRLLPQTERPPQP